MKKSLSIIFIFVLFLNIFSISLLRAEDALVPPLPGEASSGIPSALGEIDETTGLPKSFQEYQDTADKLSEEESRKEYLRQEQTKILANNKIIGPILFFSEKFFSFFNPLWIILFGIEFSWSWMFIFSMVIWIVLIVLMYAPLEAIFGSKKLMALIGSICVACLIGISGVIIRAADLLTFAVKNIWIAFLSLLITFFIVFAYKKIWEKYGKELQEQQKKEQLERDRQIIHVDAKASKKSLEGYKSK